MKVKVGQRWFWVFGAHSKVIIEIKALSKDFAEIEYVQIISYGHHYDVIGHRDYISTRRFDSKVYESFTYLYGQDRTSD
jgi:hypothetical protein